MRSFVVTEFPRVFFSLLNIWADTSGSPAQINAADLRYTQGYTHLHTKQMNLNGWNVVLYFMVKCNSVFKSNALQYCVTLLKK